MGAGDAGEWPDLDRGTAAASLHSRFHPAATTAGEMEVTGVNDFWFFVVIETLCFLVAFKTIMFLFMISSYFWGCWRCGQDICKNAMPVLVIIPAAAGRGP